MNKWLLIAGAAALGWYLFKDKEEDTPAVNAIAPGELVAAGEVLPRVDPGILPGEGVPIVYRPDPILDMGTDFHYTLPEQYQ